MRKDGAKSRGRDRSPALTPGPSPKHGRGVQDLSRKSLVRYMLWDEGHDLALVLGNLPILQRRDAGKHLPFEQFQARAAAGGDVCHLVGQPGLLDGRR